MTDSNEAEVCGIGLALDMAIQYFCTRQELDHRDELFILADCKAMINIILNRHHADSHVHVLSHIRSHLKALRDMKVDVMLVWIPENCDIYYHDIVDHCAKSVTFDSDNIRSTTVTLDTCKNSSPSNAEQHGKPDGTERTSSEQHLILCHELAVNCVFQTTGVVQ